MATQQATPDFDGNDSPLNPEILMAYFEEHFAPAKDDHDPEVDLMSTEDIAKIIERRTGILPPAIVVTNWMGNHGFRMSIVDRVQLWKVLPIE